jgi:hypothetical protein
MLGPFFFGPEDPILEAPEVLIRYPLFSEGEEEGSLTSAFNSESPSAFYRLILMTVHLKAPQKNYSSKN